VRECVALIAVELLEPLRNALRLESVTVAG
jgi:hypothetical protein